MARMNSQAQVQNDTKHPQPKKTRLQQPRKANGRFGRIRRSKVTDPSTTSNASQSTAVREDMVDTSDTHHSLTKEPVTAAEEIKSTQSTHTHAPLHNLPAAPTSLPITPPPLNTTPSHSPPLPLPSTRTTQDARTAAVVDWLHWTRNHNQTSHIVHPFNLPRPERIRPALLYQHAHTRPSGLEAGLPPSAYGLGSVASGVSTRERESGAVSDGRPSFAQLTAEQRGRLRRVAEQEKREDGLEE